MLKNKVILITGGTGSLGRSLVRKIFDDYKPKKVIVYSRDEFKQSQMEEEFSDCSELRFFLGDVRDRNRLNRVLYGVDYVVHAAALKRIPTLEYNPTEAVRTNVDGSLNVIEGCIENNVKKCVLISTDKAVNPVNLYGATKLTAEKMFLAANSFNRTRFSVVRYGNVINSRGSVIELFLKLKEQGVKEFPITDKRMTRFWITLDEAVSLVLFSIDLDYNGILVPYIPSMKIEDVARAIDPTCELKEVGVRPGEKLHEILVSEDDCLNVRIVYTSPPHAWDEVEHSEYAYRYQSNENRLWLTKQEFLEKLK